MMKKIAKSAPFCLLIGVLFSSATGCQEFWSDLDRAFSPTVDEDQMTGRGQQLLDEGNLREALKAFTAVLDANPNNADARIGIGDIHKVQGDYEKAADEYEKAVKSSPQNFQANYKLGLMHHLLNRIRQAIDSYLTALAIDPNSFEANLNIGTAYLQMEQPQLALPYAEAATRINPKSQHAYVNLGTVYSALEMHEKAIIAYREAAEYGELEPQIAINLVNSLLKSSYYERAINTLVALNGRKPSALNFERLGYTYFKMGKYDDALEAYRKAISMEPDDVQSLNGFGVCLMTKYIKEGRRNLEMRDEALRAWQRSVRIKRDQEKILELIQRYNKL